MVEAKILLNGRELGLRCWQSVPRVGDAVEVVQNSVPQKVEVTKVLWRSQTDKEFRDGITKVSIFCRE